MAHLLNVWPSVRSRLLREDRILLLFDYDGTLTPIVARPEDALLPDDVRQRLTSLASHPRFILGIVSGRSLSDLQDRAGVPGLICAGNHGMEIQGPGFQFTHPEAVSARPALQQVCSALTKATEQIPGALVEDKGLTLTVHYRGVSEERVGEIETAVTNAISQRVTEGQLRLRRGKMVVEVRPDIPWNKGKAIEKIRELYGNTPFAVYFGDDRTDEDGFFVVQEMGGLAVFVGEPRQGTVAMHQLDSPEEVWETLRLFLEELTGWY